jgi:hypothetical protein
MSAPATDFSGSVTVNMPFQLDVSGLTAELFGEVNDWYGHPIYTAWNLYLPNWYDSATGASLIHYVQDLCENSFTTVMNLAKVDGARQDLINTLNLGAPYDVNERGRRIVYLASSPYTSWNPEANGGATTWLNYYSINDFILSYIANLIFGHPGALAPIANDSSIRDSITSKIHAQMNKIYPVKGAAVDNALKPEYQDMSGVLSGLAADLVSSRGARPYGMTQANMNNIVQQFMNQSPARFMANDKGVLQPLKFQIGDTIAIHMSISKTSYKLHTPATHAGNTANNALFNPTQGQTKNFNENTLWTLLFEF